MERHTVPAILLGGWLLLTPPFNMDKGKPPHFTPRRAPVDQWDQESAHDTARECEAARGQLAAQFEREKGKVDAENRAFFTALAAASRCVPADSIYPPRRKERGK